MVAATSANITDYASLAKAQSQQVKTISSQNLTPDKIDKVAEDFESVFLSQMLSHMFPEEIDPVFGDPESDEVYRSWQIDEYAKQIAKSGGIGIASHVKGELLKLQELTSGAGKDKVTQALNAKEPKFYGLNEEKQRSSYDRAEPGNTADH